MKKYMFIIFLATFFLFTSKELDASTLLDLNETSNGNVNASVTMNEGFASAVNIIVKVDGNVHLSSINWNSNLSSDYVKRFVTSDENHYNIIISTGSAKKNLLDKNGKLDIGTLSFVNNTETTQEYKITLVSATIVNLNYAAVLLSDISEGEKAFQLEYTKPEENIPSTPQDGNEGNNDNDSQDNNSSGSNQGSNTGSSSNNNQSSGGSVNANTNNNSNNSNSNDSTNTNQEENNQEVNDNQNEDNTIEDNEVEDNKDNDKDKTPSGNTGSETDKNKENNNIKSKNDIIKYILIGVVTIFGLGIIVSLFKARKLNKLGKM